MIKREKSICFRLTFQTRGLRKGEKQHEPVRSMPPRPPLERHRSLLEQNIDSQMAKEKPRHPASPKKRPHACLMLVWTVLFTIFAVWNGTNLNAKWNTIRHPSPGSSVTLEPPPATGLDFPAITICNIADGVPLTVKNCTSPTGENCLGEIYYSTHGNRSCASLKYCFSSALPCSPYVSDPFEIDGVETTRSLIKLTVDIHKDQYPATAELRGSSVTLHENHMPPRLRTKGFYVPTGLASLVRIRKIIERALDLSEDISFEAISSYANLQPVAIPEDSDKDSLSLISIAYRVMAIRVVKETPSYDALSFLSEMGGIAGLLLGIGAYQVFETLFGAFLGE